MTTATALETGAILATARRARVQADEAEAQILAAAVAWARVHETEDVDFAATFGDTPVLIAGEGAPYIRYDAISEFAAVVGLSSASGRNLIGQALELAYRLPKVWDRIQRGSLPSWRGRRIAEETLSLSQEAAAFVDQQVAPFAHKTNLAQTQRLVDEAIARFMPAFAKKRLDDSAEQRHVTFDHQQVSFAGTSRFWGEIDLVDALELDQVIAAEAEALKDLGSDLPLDIRRAQALGNLARGQLTIRPEAGPATRDLVLYVHLGADGLGRIENAGPRPLTCEQIAAWARIPETRVVVKPVIDLNKPISTEAYECTDAIREHITLRDGTCIFPHCTRPARSCDADHTVPYDEGGETDTRNLGSLCRFHHRLKTHSGWYYTELEPGTYLWRSPHGYQFLRDRHGTEIVTPRPVDPPGD